jgi:hypothetical protein
MLRTILISALFATAAAGCYSEEPDVAYGGGGDTYAAPGLVEVSPGVDVIADYDYPVFYSDGFYWRYDGGIWYQSGFYNRGWGVAYNVPYGVRGIHNPNGYAHWHGGGGYGGVRDHRTYGGGAIARDHRSYGGYRGGAAVHPAYRGGGAVARPARGGGGSRGGGGHGRR